MGGKTLKSTALKRSIIVGRDKTSLSIQDVFWVSLEEIARERGSILSDLVASIDAGRRSGRNLSSAVRVFIPDHDRAQLTPRFESASLGGPTKPATNVRH